MFNGDYLCNKKYHGIGYDKKGNILYELKNGNGKIKEYENDVLIFEGEYLNGKKMEKEKNIIIIMVNQNLKENIQMEKEMEKEKNIIGMVHQNLKVNI